MQENLLERWSKEIFWLTSNLNPKRIGIDRKDVKRIQGVFINYFGEDYFKVEVNRVVSIDKANWINSLLVRFDFSAFTALYEIAQLLVYSMSLDESIQKKLRSHLTQYNKFRAQLFEIYVFFLLDTNGFENNKKVWYEGQEFEGTVIIDGKECVFECNKAYLSGVHAFGAIKNVAQYLNLTFNKWTYATPIVGIIEIFSNEGRAKNTLINELNKYSKQMQRSRGLDNLYEYRDTDCRISVYPYDEIRYKELEQDFDSMNLLFRVIPPAVVIPDQENFHRVHVTYRYNRSQEKVSNKLFEIIKAKRQQLEAFSDRPRIIFIDNEMQRDFQIPVIPFGQVMEEDRIQTYLNSRNTQDIVCIINRSYLDDQPHKEVLVYCKEELNPIANKIRDMKI
ncbi:MAG: hypothetical protein AAFY76_02615 [Cyanobacteria bacterium J06649_11]